MSLGISSTPSSSGPPDDETRLKAKEEALLKQFVNVKKEKKEIPWLQQWLAKEEDREKTTGENGKDWVID